MTDETTILAWHFLPADGCLAHGDGRKVEPGMMVECDPEKVKPCEYGYHGSVRAIDALTTISGICRHGATAWPCPQCQSNVTIRYVSCPHGYWPPSACGLCYPSTYRMVWPSSTPFRCPCCDGYGKRQRAVTAGTNVEYDPCASCNGTGIVWRA